MTNLSVFNALLWTDFLGGLRWFRNQTLGKIAITLLFAALFAFISVLIYSAGIGFLFPLTGFEVYGQFTALYLVHAAIIVTLWLGIGSSLVSTYSFLVRTDHQLDTLLTYPISQLVIVFQAFLRGLLSSLFWSLVIFLPLGLAVLRLFGAGSNPQTVFYLSLVITLIVVTSSTIGSFLAFILAHFHRLVKPALYVPILALLYILATLFLIRYLLPNDLARLLPASAEEFLPIFSTLPLNQLALPTLSLTNLLLGVWSASLFPLIAGLLLLLILTLIYEGRRLGSLRRSLASAPIISFSTKIPNSLFFNSNFSVSVKDIITTLRNPAEVGYGLFLLLLVLGFFLFLGSSIRATTSVRGLQSIAVYGLAWFLFYSTAYLLRLVFPLMAREGQTAWFLFTKPVRPGKIINQKTLTALALSLPLLVISLMIWPFLGNGQDLGSLALTAVVFLTFVASYLGNLFPNFRQGHDPEKVSTSAMGFFTIILLLAVSYFLITKPIMESFFIFLVGALVTLIGLKTLSVLSLRRYQF
ncbi:MAG: hypothetical protein WAV56_01925 [Microgenomates group bacterium]